MEDSLGIYIHIPFCEGGKCPYCDFYSVAFDSQRAEEYAAAVGRLLAVWGQKAGGRVVDTVYFGGGTPSLMGKWLTWMLSCVRRNFNLSADAEITLEANPGRNLYDILPGLRKSGFNRLSIGLQSAHPQELKLLGRRHTPMDAARAVEDAKRAGFENVSLDLMFCLPGQTIQSLRESIDFAAGLSVQHLSAYILKIEPGTPFDLQRSRMNLPDEDEQGEMYLAACDAIEAKGYRQYEISNFALADKQSRHNLKYWNCEEYLGIGPGAHSFFGGKRFFYPRDLRSFLTKALSVDDGGGGSVEEYVMLRLRLSEGILRSELLRRYQRDFGMFDPKKIQDLEKAGLVAADENQIRLSKKGMVVSNSVISYLIF
ncbi:MAG TPA: radical SAM family heme chaperone HemW [Clostridia bacterium]|nr:radical SAM family heme chaperone HemW [Clostridia bacterium]